VIELGISSLNEERADEYREKRKEISKEWVKPASLKALAFKVYGTIDAGRQRKRWKESYMGPE
jgi:hypothetical protein